MKRFLLKHVGNMGDMIFLVPPALAALKHVYPECRITLVTAWGFKDQSGKFGQRNQDGFCIRLMMTNPHIDKLVHWHDSKLSLDATICEEEGRHFETWNRDYYDQQKLTGGYDGIYELDFGLKIDDNPLQRVYELLGLPPKTDTTYKIYLSDSDLAIASFVMHNLPRPRIFLLEGLEGSTTRGWDPGKIPGLEKAIYQEYGVNPIWFGSKHIPYYEGRRLSIRENIATLTLGDVGIGVMSGPLHFAAAVGLPTLTLFCDQPLHRAAPAFFLNPYIKDNKKYHRTLLGPSGATAMFLKNEKPSSNLTLTESKIQRHKSWQNPGKQSTKTCLAVITVDEVMTVLREILG